MTAVVMYLVFLEKDLTWLNSALSTCRLDFALQLSEIV